MMPMRAEFCVRFGHRYRRLVLLGHWNDEDEDEDEFEDDTED